MRKRYERQSKIALRFLEAILEELKLDFIQHARNGGEFKIGRFRADGYHAASNTVYEFMGSLAHGSPLHYDADDKLRKYGRSDAGTRFQKTLAREKAIFEMGFNVAVIWDFEFKDKKLFRRWCVKVRRLLRSGKHFYHSSSPTLIEQRKHMSKKLSLKKVEELS